MNKNQKQVLDALNALPDEMEGEEVDALICSIVGAYIGNDQVPEYLMYLGVKTGMILRRIQAEAEKETKH